MQGKEDAITQDQLDELERFRDRLRKHNVWWRRLLRWIREVIGV